MEIERDIFTEALDKNNVVDNLLRSFGYEKKQSIPDTMLNSLNEKLEKGIISEELYEGAVDQLDDLLEKAGHKYFKREGVPGKYKYYYTEAQYNKEKGKSNETTSSDVKSKEDNSLIDDIFAKYAKGEISATEAYDSLPDRLKKKAGAVAPTEDKNKTAKDEVKKLGSKEDVLKNINPGTQVKFYDKNDQLLVGHRSISPNRIDVEDEDGEITSYDVKNISGLEVVKKDK